MCDEMRNCARMDVNYIISIIQKMQLKITGQQLMHGIFCAKRFRGNVLTLPFFLQKNEILVFLNKKFSSEKTFVKIIIAHKNIGHTYVKKHSSAMILRESINFSNLLKEHSRHHTHSEHRKKVVTTS